MINFSKRPFLSNYVKTIYGPQTVTLEKVIFDENFSGITGQKPVDSGHAEFVVWQKRIGTDMDALIKDFQENKMTKFTKKNSVSSNENIADELLTEADNCDYSSDCESKLSYTTSESSKLSYVLTSELKNCSYSNDFNSTSHEIKSEISSISPTLSQNGNIDSIEEVISMLDKVYLDSINCNEYKMDSSTEKQFQFYNGNVSDLTNETKRTFDGENLVNTEPVVNDSKDLTCVNSSISNLMKNTTSQVLENGTQESKDNQSLKYVVSASINAKFPSDTECLSYENISERSSMKEIADQHYKVNSHYEQSLISQNDPKITFHKNMSPFEQSSENIILQEKKIIDTTIGNTKKIDKNSDDIETTSLNSLVQQCENLVTVLKKLTISLRNDIESSKNYLKPNKHCFGQICKNVQLPHQCCCCIKIMHACCCKKTCNC